MKMKAALVYWSKSGNTEKVANAIHRGLIETEVDVSFWNLDETEEHDFLDYDLYCIGFPSYSWHTPEPARARSSNDQDNNLNTRHAHGIRTMLWRNNSVCKGKWSC